MHEPESIRENEMDKILCDIEIQTDHLIQARRPNLVKVKIKQKQKQTKHLAEQWTWPSQ